MNSLQTILIFFAISLVVFHILLFSVLTKRKFWIAVDYVWVSLAFLGVLSKSIEMRKADSQKDIRQQTNDLTSVYMRAVEQTQFIHAVLHKDNDTDAPTQDTNAVSQSGKLYHAFKDSLLNQHDAICERQDLSVWNSVYEMHKTIQQKEPEQVAEISRPLSMELGMLDQKINSINADKEKAIDSPFERGLFSIAPYLLAIAIALRLSKVTFDLRHSEGKN